MLRSTQSSMVQPSTCTQLWPLGHGWSPHAGRLAPPELPSWPALADDGAGGDPAVRPHPAATAAQRVADNDSVTSQRAGRTERAEEAMRPRV
ncbi:MAG: hypothetical protein IPI49_05095 [Myxococcales bacterium]|nr:hypothetical protein [Myxococcales bacterium]